MKFFIKFYLFLDKSLLDFIDKLTAPIICQNNVNEIHNDGRDDDMLTFCGMYTLTILPVILLTQK